MKKILSLALLSVISASATTKVLLPSNPSLSKTWSNESNISRSIRSLKDEVKNPEYTEISAAKIATDFAKYHFKKSETRGMFADIAKKISKKKNSKNYDEAVVVEQAVSEVVHEIVKRKKGTVTKENVGEFYELINNMISMAAEIKASKEEAAKAGLKSTLETELRQALRVMIGPKEAREFMRILNLLERNGFVNDRLSENIIAESLSEYMEQADELASIDFGLEQLFAADPFVANKTSDELCKQKKALQELVVDIDKAISVKEHEINKCNVQIAKYDEQLARVKHQYNTRYYDVAKLLEKACELKEITEQPATLEKIASLLRNLDQTKETLEQEEKSVEEQLEAKRNNEYALTTHFVELKQNRNKIQAQIIALNKILSH